jgi:hypothetical protein
MKTMWNIKSETNRLKDHTVSKYENPPDTFNNYFLSVSEKIMQSIAYSNTEGTSDNKNPTYCLSKVSYNPFPDTTFNNTSTKKLKELLKKTPWSESTSELYRLSDRRLSAK